MPFLPGVEDIWGTGHKGTLQPSAPASPCQISLRKSCRTLRGVGKEQGSDAPTMDLGTGHVVGRGCRTHAGFLLLPFKCTQSS